MFNSDALMWPKRDRESNCTAARDAKESSVGASKYLNKSLGVIAGHPKREMLPRPESSFAHSSNHDLRRSCKGDAYYTSNVLISSTLQSLALASPGLANLHEYPGWC